MNGTKSRAAYFILQAALPGAAPENFGVLLIDPDANRLHSLFRRDIREFAGGEADWFECVADDIRQTSEKEGARQYLAWMESTLSNALLISPPESVIVDDYQKALARLYAEHIRPRVLPFRTHLPQYSLAAAAGRFGKQMEAEPEGWIEVRPNFPLTYDMFIVHVVGGSMAPLIPDGSRAAFRAKVDGSYADKVVLVERYGEVGGNRFAVSRYHASSSRDDSHEGDGKWLHERITLEPLHADYPSWEVPCAEQARVLGEFLFVVEVSDQNLVFQAVAGSE